MKLFNYLKVFGAFTDAHQIIWLAKVPADRAERKMLEEANRLIEASWARRQTFLESRIAAGVEIDLDAEKAAFFPAEADGQVGIPLQFLQDYMVRKIAAIQNNVSIHNKAEVTELKSVFDDYGVTLTATFEKLVFRHISWSAKDRQKPKLLIHAQDIDGEDVCIRLEAASELCQKVLNAMYALGLIAGQEFSLAFEAIDPAIERNKRAGKSVAETGKYVNHNVTLTMGAHSHSGYPPKGEKFIQKPTMEFMENLFDVVCNAQKAAKQ